MLSADAHRSRSVFITLCLRRQTCNFELIRAANINLKQVAQTLSKASPPADILMSINKRNDEVGPPAYIFFEYQSFHL